MTYSRMRRASRLTCKDGDACGDGDDDDGDVGDMTSMNGVVTSRLVLWKKSMFSGVRSCFMVLMTVWSSWVSVSGYVDAVAMAIAMIVAMSNVLMHL